ncbi:hypothetical protein JL49_07990, partial [Pseudoalteromonas luteoviolacea]
MTVGRDLAVSVVIGAALAGSFKTVIGQSVNQFNQLGDTINKVESQTSQLTGFKTLNTKLQRAHENVEQTQQSLKKYQHELNQVKKAHGSLVHSVKQASQEVDKSETRYKNAQTALEQLKREYGQAKEKSAAMRSAIVFSNQAVKQAEAEFTQAKTALKGATSELNKNAESNKKLKDQIAQTNRQLNKQVEQVHSSQRALNEHRKAMNANGVSAGKLTKKQAKLGDTLTHLKAQYREMNTVMRQHQSVLEKRGHYRSQALDAVALGGAMITPIAAAVKFESVMADVRKVVNFESPAGFAQMGQDILRLSTHIPMAADGLGDIVAAAGQAGIARNELLTFAKDAAMMGVAFDMSGKEAGSAMTGLRSIFKLNQGEVVQLGDAYNHLSNSMDATARDMLNISNRAGSMGKLFGLTGQQVGALGATFLELKTPPEIAATGINALLLKLKTADKQGKKFSNALSTMGLSAEGLKASIEQDAQGALLSFLETVKQSDDITGTLADLFGAEYSDDMAKLVDGLDGYKKALSLIGQESKYAGSMQSEFKTRSETTANSLTLFKNQLNRLGVTVGSVLLPPLNAVLGVLGSVINTVATVAHTFPTATKVVVGLTMGLALLKVGSIAGGYAMTFLQGGALNVTKALKSMGIATTLNTLKLNGFNASVAATTASTTALGAASGATSFATKISTLGATLTAFSTVTLPAVVVGIRAMGVALMTTPIGWAVMAIAAGATLIYKYWQPISSFMGGVWDGFVTSIKPVITSLAPVGKLFGWVGDKIGSLIGWIGGLFTPVNLASEKLESFASTGQTIGSVFGGLVNVVTAPFRGAMWFIDKTLSSIGKLGDAIGGLGSWLGFGDDESSEPNKSVIDLVKPVALASTLAVTPALADIAESPNTKQPVLTQSVNQELTRVDAPTLPEVNGEARYQGHIDLEPLPMVNTSTLTQPVVQHLEPVQTVQPNALTQSVNQELKHNDAPTLPEVNGEARYQGRVELEPLPTVNTSTLTQPVVQHLEPVQTVQPNALTQSVNQELSRIDEPKLPEANGEARYQGRVDLEPLPTIKTSTLTQPVVQHLKPVQTAQPNALTQSVNQEL